MTIQPINWGWSALCEARYRSVLDGYLDFKTIFPARVATLNREIYDLHSGRHTYRATLSGAMRHRAESRFELPVVGDWVLVKANSVATESTKGNAEIISLLPRVNLLQRAAKFGKENIFAANIDLAILMTAVPDDLNLRRFERTLLSIANSGARSLLLVNKTDLINEAQQKSLQRQVVERFPKLSQLWISLRDGQASLALDEFIDDLDSVVLIGSSGVGKSTLVNQLVSGASATTREVLHSGKGSHTTTQRKIYALPRGAVLIDTPGVRDWGNDAEDQHSLGDVFENIEAFARECKFSDCRHDSEPHCRVKLALKREEILADQWKNYQKLCREMHFQERKSNKALRAAFHAKIKKGAR